MRTTFGAAAGRWARMAEPLESRLMLSAATLVADVRPGPDSAGPSSLTDFGGSLYFAADDGVHGGELWKSDGSTATLVKDLAEGPPASTPASFTVANGLLFFTAGTAQTGVELWRTDGTAAGTLLVKDIRPGPDSSSPYNLITMGSSLYFVADDGASGVELWRSDGTNAGTHIVRDIAPAAGASSFPDFPAVATTLTGTFLFFSADDGTAGGELWRSDGTESGTQLVRDISAGGGSYPYGLAAFNNAVYFAADNGASGYELWRSDGSLAGTQLVREIRPSFAGSDPYGLTVAGGTLYFVADNGTQGAELWRSDGTTAGTMLARDIQGGFFGSYPYGMTAFGDALLFAADNGADGYELWRADGPVVSMVKDVNALAGAGSGLYSITNYDGGAYFAADDGVNGFELWRTDGTMTGTMLAADVAPGTTSANPSALAVSGGMLYFAADDGTHGYELWNYGPFAVLSDGVLTVNGTSAADAISLAEIGGNIEVSVNAQVTSFPAQSVTGVSVNSRGGDDVFDFNGPVAAPVVFHAGSGNATLNVNSGTFTFAANAPVHDGDTLSVVVKGGATVLFDTTQYLASLDVLAGGVASVNAGRNRVLVVGSLNIAGSGKLDLNDNDLMATATPVQTIASYIAAARNGGAWDQGGITSTAARTNPVGSTTLGVLLGAEYMAASGSSTFSGLPFTAADVLAKYTYYGDTDYTGQVDFDDYVRTDNGFNTGAAGWLNGDFDLNGFVDFDDYVLLDLGFNTQGSQL